MSAKEQKHSENKVSPKSHSSKPAASSLETAIKQPAQPAALFAENGLRPNSLSASNVLHLQRAVGNQAVGRALSGALQMKDSMTAPSAVRHSDRTGLPDNLKAGVESLSGFSLDNVNVHYNSTKPAQLNALAYAQDLEIHVAPGQEKHLPHEVWHVVQQASGNVKPTLSVKDGPPINDDERLEHEADALGTLAAQSAFASPASSSLAEVGLNRQPAQRAINTLQSGVVQRVVKGLEQYSDPTQIPESWVSLYLADIVHDHAHLSHIDLVLYLDAQDPTWKKEASLIYANNHWDVEVQGKGIIRTRSDGNCGVHAIEAIRNRTSPEVNSHEEYCAGKQAIQQVRSAIMKRLSEERREVRERIALEIKRSSTYAECGFGPQLQEEVRQLEAAANQESGSSALLTTVMDKPSVSQADPQSSVSQVPVDREAAALKAKILQIERALIHMVDAEAVEKRFMQELEEKIELELQPKLVKLESSQGEQKLPAETERVEQEKARVLEELRVKYCYYDEEKKSAQRLERAPASLKKYLPIKLKEWESLMEQLCGTHQGTATAPHLYNKLFSQRHDGQMGSYGRIPTEEDQKIGELRLEVLHGHGAWTRKGLLSSISTPDLTSWEQILERANQLREAKKWSPIAGDKVDLAFVSHHGIPTASGPKSTNLPKLETGVYPDLFDIPPKIVAEVERIKRSVHADRKEASEKIDGADYEKSAEFDEKFKKRCQKIPKRLAGYAARNKDHISMVWKDLLNEQAYAAFQRMKKYGSAKGQSARYVEILGGKEHRNVLFPDMILGPLNPLEALGVGDDSERLTGYDRDLKKYSLPNVNLSMAKNFPEEFKTELGITIKLSQAIISRLAQIENVEQPIRFFWAACRSEQLPANFNQEMFLQWIRNAAKAAQK